MQKYRAILLETIHCWGTQLKKMFLGVQFGKIYFGKTHSRKIQIVEKLRKMRKT